MLDSLYVKNLALIDEEEVTFTEGLNVLSGETGAGKSILIGSVLIALGAKVHKEMIRANEKEAYIELIFSPTHPAILEKLREYDIEPEDGQLIISKKITASKSVSKINKEAYPASKVREVASLLLDVHGQHDHQALIHQNKQLEIVDRSGGKNLKEAKEQTAKYYRVWKQYKDELDSYSVDEDERLRRMDILCYELDELKEASITPGEEARLSKDWKRLSEREHIITAYQELTSLLGYESNGACDLCGRAEHALKGISEADEEAQSLYDQLTDAESIIHDICREASERLDAMQDEELDTAKIEERLDQIRHLMQKYRCDEEGLLKLTEKKEQELEKYRHFEEEKARAQKLCQNAFIKLEQSADDLSSKRRECADLLCDQLIKALVDLNFLDVRFEIRMDQTEQIGPGGKDVVTFYIATNPGEALKPLAAVASGGELSRIMLAVKSVMAQKEEIETLIFDEIDTGISGRTAQKVAKRLSETAKGSQVICISHLAQIVSMADTHFLIEKNAENEKTTTHITKLSEEESIREVARLLGGAEITKNVLDTAKEMKDMANRTKESQITK